jgi:archaetidylinositol phosphate synthase
MLNKFRSSLEPLMSKVGKSFVATGVSANTWTALGLLMSVVAGMIYLLSAPAIGFSLLNVSIVGSILLLISGFFDMIDGIVARATKRSSKKGAFLDSSFDKIAEAIIFIGIAGGGLADPILCMIAMSVSLLVSYVRARAESLGIELKGVGIGERAERILVLAIMGMIPVVGAMQYAVIAISLLAGVTLVQRVVAASKKL